MAGADETERQRLDLWLWCARMTRTRVAAQDLVARGHVRINGRRVEAPARPVRPGDVLTIALAHDTKVLRVLRLAKRRGGAETAGQLYCDIMSETDGRERFN